MKRLGNKVVPLVVVTAMVFSMCGCKSSDNTDETTASDAATESTESQEPTQLTPEEVVDKYIETMAKGEVADAHTLYAVSEDAFIYDESAELRYAPYITYFDSMEYETSLVSDDGKSAVVKITGTAYDIDGAIDALYDGYEVNMVKEVLYLENHDDTYGSVDNDMTVVMGDSVVDYMTNNAKVDFEMEYTLSCDEDGAYKIVSPDELLPLIQWDSTSYSDEEMSELMKTALLELLEEERITQEEYDSLYTEYFGEEVLETVDEYITEVIEADLAQNGAQGALADSYYSGLDYSVDVSEVTTTENGTEATVVISGTAPDVDGAIANAITNDKLISYMTSAAYAALNSGSIGAGQSTAESLLKNEILNGIESQPGVPFKSTIRIVIKENGDTYVEGLDKMFPDMPSSINMEDIDRGQLRECARAALGNLLASGAITPEEYDEYCGRIGDYI